jgi:hypothetical protein
MRKRMVTEASVRIRDPRCGMKKIKWNECETRKNCSELRKVLDLGGKGRQGKVTGLKRIWVRKEEERRFRLEIKRCGMKNVE